MLDLFVHDEISCSVNKQLIVPCWTGYLANADKWKIAFAILVSQNISADPSDPCISGSPGSLK